VRKADKLPPSCAVVTKSGNLNFLEPSGPVQACNGTAFTDIIVGCHHLSQYTTLQTFLPAFYLVQEKLSCSCFANLLCTAVASPHVISMQKCCLVTENNARLRTKHKICSKHLPHNHPHVNSTSSMFLV